MKEGSSSSEYDSLWFLSIKNAKLLRDSFLEYEHITRRTRPQLKFFKDLIILKIFICTAYLTHVY